MESLKTWISQNLNDSYFICSFFWTNIYKYLGEISHPPEWKVDAEEQIHIPLTTNRHNWGDVQVMYHSFNFSL